VYTLTLILYVLTLWVQVPYSLKPVQRFLYDVCEPYLRFWRRLLPFAVGPMDFSPIVGIFAIGIAIDGVFGVVDGRIRRRWGLGEA